MSLEKKVNDFIGDITFSNVIMTIGIIVAGYLLYHYSLCTREVEGTAENYAYADVTEPIYDEDMNEVGQYTGKAYYTGNAILTIKGIIFKDTLRCVESGTGTETYRFFYNGECVREISSEGNYKENHFVSGTVRIVKDAMSQLQNMRLRWNEGKAIIQKDENCAGQYYIGTYHCTDGNGNEVSIAECKSHEQANGTWYNASGTAISKVVNGVTESLQHSQPSQSSATTEASASQNEQTATQDATTQNKATTQNSSSSNELPTEAVCPACHGTGQIMCSVCGGGGSNIRYSHGSIVSNTCNACNGAGFIQCAGCAGMGRIFYR